MLDHGKSRSIPINLNFDGPFSVISFAVKTIFSVDLWYSKTLRFSLSLLNIQKLKSKIIVSAPLTVDKMENWEWKLPRNNFWGDFKGKILFVFYLPLQEENDLREFYFSPNNSALLFRLPAFQKVPNVRLRIFQLELSNLDFKIGLAARFAL